jgi:hypothetical protein
MKTIKLTESDLIALVNRVLQEQREASTINMRGTKPTMTRFDENMGKISENQLIKLTNLMLEELNSEITFSDLEVLKKINSLVNRQEVIQWFNDNDLDYYNITDIEMYMIYIERNMEEMDMDYDEFGSVEETDFISDDTLNEAEYQGRKVKLGKIMQGDIKKFKVYVKNDKGKVVKVNFGFGGKSAHGKRMVIKKNNPERRKSFRARHNCDNPGPRWKPRYWACRSW